MKMEESHNGIAAAWKVVTITRLGVQISLLPPKNG